MRRRAKRQAHALAFFAALLLAPAPIFADPPSRPNVLFIICDDLRWNAMSCAGHPALKTPHIDRIAQEGVRFANAFCTTSLCSPSRASILTGLYTHAHGVTNNFTELSSVAGRIGPSGCARKATRRPTLASGTWARTTTPRARLRLLRHATRGRENTSAPNGSVNGDRGGAIPGYYTTVVTDMALDWLKRDHGGKPWALCLGQKAPHSPYSAEEVYAHAV